MKNKTHLKFWPFIGLLALTACTNEKGQHISIMSNILGTPPGSGIPIVYTGPFQAPAQYAYILMGQSNMTRMFQSHADNFLGWPSFEASPAIAIGMNDPHALYIQCGVASTPIKRWIPGGDLYETCLGYVPPNVPVRGVFYWQGEADTQPIPGFATDAWAQSFENIVLGLRAHFSNLRLPVVFAQIGTNQRPDTYDPVLWQHVKDQQASVCMSNVRMVTTDDQMLEADGEHLLSYETVGQRMAQAMKGIL